MYTNQRSNLGRLPDIKFPLSLKIQFFSVVIFVPLKMIDFIANRSIEVEVLPYNQFYKMLSALSQSKE